MSKDRSKEDDGFIDSLVVIWSMSVYSELEKSSNHNKFMAGLSLLLIGGILIKDWCEKPDPAVDNPEGQQQKNPNKEEIDK